MKRGSEGRADSSAIDPERIVAAADAVLAGQGKAGRRPQLWDGRAAQQIVERLAEQLAGT